MPTLKVSEPLGSSLPRMAALFSLGSTMRTFHRLNREDALSRYSTIDRGEQVHRASGGRDRRTRRAAPIRNAYGHLPSRGFRPTRPAVKEGPANDYWDHVDYIVREANALGSTLVFCRRGAATGTTRRKTANRSSTGPMPRFTASGWADATRTRASSGFSAATARSTMTSKRKSFAPWRAACARATAART